MHPDEGVSCEFFARALRAKKRFPPRFYRAIVGLGPSLALAAAGTAARLPRSRMPGGTTTLSFHEGGWAPGADQFTVLQPLAAVINAADLMSVFGQNGKADAITSPNDPNPNSPSQPHQNGHGGNRR